MSKVWSFGRVFLAVAERGVDAALRGAGVTADRVHLGDDGDVGTAFGGFDGCAHAGEPAADDDDVVFDQLTFEVPSMDRAETRVARQSYAFGM